MRIFIEGEKYKLDLLISIFGEKFYLNMANDFGKIEQIGFYHSKNHELIYLLPKVFLDKNNLIFNKYSKKDLSENNLDSYIKNPQELIWIKHFLLIFYKSLIEYKKRYINTTIISKDETLQLNTTIGQYEFSYLDILLSLMHFHKQNKNIILYRLKEYEANKFKSVNWNKTVKKNNVIFSSSQEPIYIKPKINKKEKDTEEELLLIYYSVLYQISKELNIRIEISQEYVKFKGTSFKKLIRKAPKILQKIKYKYFTDVLIKMHNLLSIYFTKKNLSSIKGAKEDYIMVKNYHLVFEDMIDKLFSDDLSEIKNTQGISLKKLKLQKDGKEIDHIFEYKSLLDIDETIYYIGDSKYYKTKAVLQENSIYKQFTYAKNVIQFNIDLLNQKKRINKELVYRDSLTDGYNITPNFFIQGIITDITNFEDHNLQQDESKKIAYSYHYKDRLFDRDSLFVQYYNINFLFVLNSYSKRDIVERTIFKKKIKYIFRENFIKYFEKQKNYKFYQYSFKNFEEISKFIDDEFRVLNGKIYRVQTDPYTLILAMHKEDMNLQEKINYLKNTNSIIYLTKNNEKIIFKKFIFK